MALTRTNRGIGSNQYADKESLAADNALVSEMVQRKRHLSLVTTPSSPVADNTLQGRSPKQLAAGLSQSIDNHLEHYTNQSSSSPVFADQDSARQSTNGVAAYEDAIYQKYPNAYGRSLINAIWWGKSAQYDPQVRKALAQSDPEVTHLSEQYLALMDDAYGNESSQMTPEQLHSTLNEISESETRWYGREETQDKETRSLSNKLAALSVASSRCSEVGELKRIQSQIDGVQRDLNKKKLDSIGL